MPFVASCLTCLLALRAYGPDVPTCLKLLCAYVLTCLTCLWALRTYLPTCRKLLRDYMLTCLRFLRAYVPLFFTCLRAYVRLSIFFHAYVPSWLKLFRAHSENILRLTSVHCIAVSLWIIWPFILFKNLKQTPSSKTAYLNPILWGFIISTSACTKTIIWGLVKKLSKQWTLSSILNF